MIRMFSILILILLLIAIRLLTSAPAEPCDGLRARNELLISNYIIVTEGLKRSRDRAFRLGYIEGKIDQARYIFGLVESNKSKTTNAQ